MRVQASANDNVTLTISNGLLRSTVVNQSFAVAAGNTLIVTNGGKLITSQLNFGGTVLVSGPGSYVQSTDGGNGLTGSTNIINNGAAMLIRPLGSTAESLLLIDNATMTNQSATLLTFAGSTIILTNGGVLVAQAASNPMLFGQQNGDTSRIIVGGGPTVSTFDQNRLFTEETTPTARGDTETIILSNGVMKIRGGIALATYTNVTQGLADVRISDGSFVSLRGGTVQMNTGTVFTLADYTLASVGAAGKVQAGTGVLRGFGTFSNYNAGANFKVVNDGVIRVGDVGRFTEAISSNTPGMGSLNLVRGDLLQTNSLSYVSSAIFFDFSDTALDQINISGGSAVITGGSNVWSLAAGSAPLGKYKWGLGTYDFIIGTNIVWSPEVANLTNLLTAAGLVQNLDYRFGVMDIGNGLQALRLEFVPEPSTVLLLLGGGLLVWRSRRRQNG